MEEDNVEEVIELIRRLRWFLFGLCAVVILSCIYAEAQVPNDGIPEADRNNLQYRLFTYSKDGVNHIEYQAVPSLIRDFGKLGYITVSPNDPNRNFSQLPNFQLAEFHHWLFKDDVLIRSQTQFADVIGQIKAYQMLLGETPLIDDPASPNYDNIVAVREYLVPFKPVQNQEDPTLFPRLEDQIQHIEAAIISINERVFFRGLYEGLAVYYKEKARAKIFNDGAAAMYFELERQGWRRPKK